MTDLDSLNRNAAANRNMAHEAISLHHALTTLANGHAETAETVDAAIREAGDILTGLVNRLDLALIEARMQMVATTEAE